MKNPALYLILMLLLHFEPVRAQGALDSIVVALGLKAKARPPELLYIQTSKDTYETGEDLWFKLYQFDAHNLHLSGRSRSLYMRVVREKDEAVVWQEMYAIDRGVAQGHLYIDKKLEEGSYAIEVYTSMSTYSGKSSFFANRKIRVVGNIDKTRFGAEKQPVDTLIRFEIYPEGGNLIQGISNRLAFKATDGRGMPREITGAIYEDGQSVGKFNSVHDGMGSLYITPAAGKTYHLALTNGREYPLPKVHPQGIAMRQSARNEQYLEFTIQQSPGQPATEIYLMAQVRGVSYCGAKATVKDSITVKLPMREFSTQGIAEVTLFDRYQRPIAERLVYLYPQKKLFIRANTDKKHYFIRGNGRLDISVTDQDGQPVRAHLGVSVFDKVYADPSYPVNIQTHTMLSSQIKGNIHRPGYYFDERNADRLEAMDLLLMTQGWRRYTWAYDIPDEMGKQFLYDEIRGIQIVRKNKALSGTQLLVQASGADAKSLLVWTDSIGRFMLQPEMLSTLQGGYLYLTPMIGRENEPRITLDDPFVDIEKERRQKQSFYPFVNGSLIKQENLRRPSSVSLFGELVLDEFTIKTKRRKPFRDKFMGSLDSLTQMKINGPWVCKHGFLENYRTGYSHLMGDKNSPVQCAESVEDTLNTRRKPVVGETYDLVKYEPNGPNGIYILTSIIRGVVYSASELKEEDLLKINNITRTKGYYGAREFYVPDQHDRLDPTPDVRNTLLWNPVVITDEQGKATLEFPCSDINSTFLTRIEGTNGLGLLGTAEIEFNVVRPSKGDE